MKIELSAFSQETLLFSSVDASVDPSLYPSVDPSVDPAVDPSVDPSVDQSVDPLNEPSVNPSVDPSVDPSTHLYVKRLPIGLSASLFFRSSSRFAHLSVDCDLLFNWSFDRS